MAKLFVIAAPSTVADIFNDPKFEALSKAYFDESVNALVRDKEWRVATETYDQLETAGRLLAYAARVRDTGELVGFGAIVLSMSLHTGRKMANVETFYIDPEWRATGAGLRMLAWMKRDAASYGADGLMVTALRGTKFAEIVERQKVQFVSAFLPLGAKHAAF